MPYTSVRELPDPVRNNLPVHAQKIFKDAFNSAYHGQAHGNEVRCFKIAWSDVKKTYEKRNGKWKKKSGSAAA